LLERVKFLAQLLNSLLQRLTYQVSQKLLDKNQQQQQLQRQGVSSLALRKLVVMEVVQAVTLKPLNSYKQNFKSQN